LSLLASIVSDHGPPRLYFELLKLLHPDIIFLSNADLDPNPASKNNADADPDLGIFF
jgi:hypothetical protein